MKPWLVIVVLVFSACSSQEQDFYQGYAEGDFVRVAAPFAGRLVELSTRRGDYVKAGDPLYVLEQENEAADRREAEERLERAEAQLANQTKAKRAPELAMIQAEIRQAEANVTLSELLLRRREVLLEANVVSKEERDEARATYERDHARLAELQAQLANAKLPVARPDEIKAADAEVAAAKAALAQAEWRLAQKSVSAPQAGLVNDTLFVEGEWVAAGAPVVSILPAENIHVRFFIPEPALGAIHVGDQVSVQCDGCTAPISATVSFIAAEAEFTPPVIYSRESRYKLVYLVRAQPSPQDAVLLHPGQPVEVTITQK
ncbi:MAG: HlyD family efflux transporter periplasmic adaptor subunit [Gammaproteobacteria bacterium]|nr:HlyD family efflux transporter periplasmic adaptor subunit [Gammaproteobacteria bacterium]